MRTEPIGRLGSRMQNGEPPRRAVVLVGHGVVSRGYPRERLMQLRALQARQCASGAPPSEEEAALERELRHWPRTPANDRHQAGPKSLTAQLRPRLEPARPVLAYNKFCAPTVAEAIRALAAEGVADIVAVLSMFTPGAVHTEIEIPETISALRVELPRLRLQYAWPFAEGHLAAFFAEHLRRFDSR